MILVGECPRSYGGEPFDSETGRKLAQIAGLTFYDLTVLHELVALLPHPVRDKWPIASARFRASELRARGRPMILCGRRVAEAFGVHSQPPAEWHADLAWIQHPSGRNSFWKSPESEPVRRWLHRQLSNVERTRQS